MQLSEKDKYAISLADNLAAWSYAVNSTVIFPEINDIIKLYYHKKCFGIFKVKSISYNDNMVFLYKFYKKLGMTVINLRLAAGGVSAIFFLIKSHLILPGLKLLLIEK